MSNQDLATSVGANPKKTEVGSVFVSNYPPYSFWTEEAKAEHLKALERKPNPDTPLGLYIHIPFCRKRCKFCYFKVYTDKKNQEIARYIDAVVAELKSYVAKPLIEGRPLKFIYFGGGTPSYISSRHLRQLVDAVKELLPWDQLEEVTFECEPGTLTQSKLETLKEIGITRLSLGVENWDDRILEENGRAHVSKEIERVLPWIADLNFDQLNIDLISGMVVNRPHPGRRASSARSNWLRIRSRLPDGTAIQYGLFQSVLGGNDVSVADWETKRKWHDYAIDKLSENGYEISSGYTMVRKGGSTSFVYRNSVWQGCDLLSVGVSSFGHLSGVHYQNTSRWDDYLAAIDDGQFSVHRAFVPSSEERLVREFILQLKLGNLNVDTLCQKYDVDVLEKFNEPLAKLAEREMLNVDGNWIRLTRQGLLRVDSLLPEFYSEKYQNSRYT